MRAYERFLRYVKIPSASAYRKGVTPSTACQWEMARLLVEELRQLGLENPTVNENCIVTAWLPATAGCEDAPALGFLAHMDTSPSFPGENVEPILHPDYDGGDIVLPREGRIIRAAEFPFLSGLKGQTLITADGSTLLGADDKAGIAEIVTMCEDLIRDGAPHGRLCIAFTPDEEIGEGPDNFDVAAFGAKYAYTMDGGLAGCVEYENFNAASAKVEITGVAVHPGSAKGVMENALLLAQELNACLPPHAIPAETSGYEGFFHLDHMKGNAATARMDYILRDHDKDKFQEKKALLEAAAEKVRQNHPTARVKVTIQDGYYNMKDQLAGCMHLIENAKEAMRRAGLTPVTVPIRGGTDGARLSYMGLPCPNLGTGSANCHGPMELCSVEQMDKTVQMMKHLVAIYAQKAE